MWTEFSLRRWFSCRVKNFENPAFQIIDHYSPPKSCDTAVSVYFSFKRCGVGALLFVADCADEICAGVVFSLKFLIGICDQLCRTGCHSCRWPGDAPGGVVTCSFAQKKSHHRCVAPTVCALRCRYGNLRCSLQVGSRSNSPAAQTIAGPGPLEAALLGAYRWGTPNAGSARLRRASRRSRCAPTPALPRWGREKNRCATVREGVHCLAPSPPGEGRDGGTRALGTMGRCAPPIPLPGVPL